MTIEVKKDRLSGKWKVLVDYVQRGVLVHTAMLANNMATQVHDNELPHADLILAQTIS